MHHTLTRSLVLLLCSSLIALASALTQTPPHTEAVESHSHTQQTDEAESHSHREDAAAHSHDEPSAGMDEITMDEMAMDEMAMDGATGHEMTMTADSEASFVTQMIPHHQEAVASSRALLRTTQDRVLRNLAATIIETQSREIRTLRSWQAQWYPDAPPAPYMPMMPELRGLTSPEAERAFLEGMVGHHQGALEMAQSYLGGTFDKHPEVTRLARGILTSQTGEIGQMQTLLDVEYGPREAGAHDMATHEMTTHEMDMTAKSEADFITQMIPHHQEAVTSSRALLEQTERPELRYFAKTIMQVQQREVLMLRDWQARWYPDAPQAAYMPMMPPLRGLSPEEAEQAFLGGMVGHHEGALEMAQSYLKGNFEKHDEVVRLARAIVVAQKGEISQMQAWLGAWFGAREAAALGSAPDAPAPTSEPHDAQSHGTHEH